MDKPTTAALDAFDRTFPDDPRAVRKKMFGMPAGFVQGNMFFGVGADGVVLRLGEARRGDLSAQDGVVAFEPHPGRPWKEYVLVDAGRGDDIAGWALEDLEFTSTLPPKAPRPRKKPT